jgi:hypothetical protein
MDPLKCGSYSYKGLDFSFLYEPFYIGKGKKGRYLSHLNENNLTMNTFMNNKLKKILKLVSEPFVIKLYENLTEEEAYNIEIDLISKIGKRSKKQGPLTNLSDGGGGSPMRGEEHANWGKSLKESTKKKISERLKLNNPMHNPEVSEKVRQKNLGREPWNKGKSEKRPEVIKKLSQKKIKYKNIKAVHCVLDQTLPTWFKFSEGIVDNEIVQMQKAESPYACDHRISVNRINEEGNRIIFEKLVSYLESFNL